jgi:hypothetical protein
MVDNELLSQINIAKPCPMDWNGMSGNDRMRFCDSCGKHVYNFAAMTSGEASDLIRGQGGEVCGRLNRHSDGTVITADSPVEALTEPGRWQFHIRTIMAVIAGFAALLGLARLTGVFQDSETGAATAGVRTTVLGIINTRSANESISSECY